MGGGEGGGGGNNVGIGIMACTPNLNMSVTAYGEIKCNYVKKIWQKYLHIIPIGQHPYCRKTTLASKSPNA